MCNSCGCDAGQTARLTHFHEHDGIEHHSHEQLVPHTRDRRITLEAALLQKNDDLAKQNRQWFAERSMLVVNLLGGPGAGKTALLEKTLCSGDFPALVVEGDQSTLNDAERIRAIGVPSVQINTGTGCHLEADMLMKGVRCLDPDTGSVLFVENVGNLVCPALFDLGEGVRVVMLSVTEGEDKPLKYPHMFRSADLVLVSKVDLLPYLAFDLGACRANIEKLNPRATVIELSAQTGVGLAAWSRWLRRQRPTMG
jgi:hydrogenase nickel incorporation protein HypB